MKFANPLFFWALLSLLVPIIIHLFHFRKFKTIYFTNVRFLKELRQETQSRSRLRHLLILISRCLALIALVIAFAQPFIPTSAKQRTGTRAISIYIDNSFSLDAQAESGSLIELARKHAQDIVRSYKPSDRFQLLTNDFEGKHQQLLTREQFEQLLDEVKPSPVSRNLSEVVQRQEDLIRQEKADNGILYLLSDFQKNTSDLSAIRPDTAFDLNCIHLKAQISDNLSLDSCWFETPFRERAKPDQLLFKAVNSGKKRYENVPLKLSINGTERGLESISAGPDSTIQSAISFTSSESGFHSGEIRFSDNPVTFDDAFYFAYNVPDKIRILVLNGKSESPYLQQLYGRNPAFELRNSSAQQIDYTLLAAQELIVLNELPSISSGLSLELNKFVKNGGSVCVLPDLAADIESYRSFSNALGIAAYTTPVQLAQKADKINLQHPLYDDVFEKKQENIDLPSVKSYVPFKAAGKVQEDVLMRLQNGDLFMASYISGKGKVYLSAVPLEENASNFPRHAMFIPTFYKMALYSTAAARLYYTIGEETPIELTNAVLSGDQTLRIKALKGTFEMIPEHRTLDGKTQVFVRNQITEAGNYQILQGYSVLAVISFNYNRKESSSNFFGEDEVLESLEKAGWTTAHVLDGSMKELKQEVSQLDEGRPFWKIFLVLALLFLAIEIALIRLMK
ncbi:MAG: hypothetical protein RLZZ543_133 [Bacteroidota bacterium]